jgi:hypothetical protein
MAAVLWDPSVALLVTYSTLRHVSGNSLVKAAPKRGDLSCSRGARSWRFAGSD